MKIAEHWNCFEECYTIQPITS